jgi:hypothetical protein
LPFLGETGAVTRRWISALVALVLVQNAGVGPAVAWDRKGHESKTVLVAQAEFVSAIAFAERAYRESVRAAEAAYKEALKIAGSQEAMKRAQAQAFAWQARELAKARTLSELLQIEVEMQEKLRIAVLHLNPKKSRELARQARDKAIEQAELRLLEAKRAATARLNEVLLRHGYQK